MPRKDIQQPRSEEQIRDIGYIGCVLLSCRRQDSVQPIENHTDSNNKPTVDFKKSAPEEISIRTPSGETKHLMRIHHELPGKGNSQLMRLMSPETTRWGFKASAFVELDEQKKPTGTLFMAFPGVWQARDYTASVVTGSGFRGSPQVNEVPNFYNKVKQQLQENNISINNVENIGHSLGTQNAIAQHRMLSAPETGITPRNAVHTTILDGFGARVGVHEQAAYMAKEKTDITISLARNTVIQAIEMVRWAGEKLAFKDEWSQKMADLRPKEARKVRASKYRESILLTRNMTTISADSFLSSYPDGYSVGREQNEEAIGGNAFFLTPPAVSPNIENRRENASRMHDSAVLGKMLMNPHSLLADQHNPSISGDMKAPKLKDVMNQERGFLPVMWAHTTWRTGTAFINNYTHQHSRLSRINNESIERHKLQLEPQEKALAQSLTALQVARIAVLENLGNYKHSLKPNLYIQHKIREQNAQKNTPPEQANSHVEADGTLTLSIDDKNPPLLDSSVKKSPPQHVQEILNRGHTPPPPSMAQKVQDELSKDTSPSDRTPPPSPSR